MRTVKMKCGCRYTEEPARWVTECEAHKTETQEIRTRWAQELVVRRASNQTLEETQS